MLWSTVEAIRFCSHWAFTFDLEYVFRLLHVVIVKVIVAQLFDVR